MDREGLYKTARRLVADGKGILAADESFGTIKKRFDALHIESSDATRCAYREMLVTSPGIEKFISGVIFFDETIRQTTTQKITFPQVLANLGILTGIKVDYGTKDLAGFPGEVITEGLDGLRGRLAEYRNLGASFTKWRVVINIGPGLPTRTCIEANAEVLSRYAALAQEAGLAPIIEPEVLMDGGHSLAECERATVQTLSIVFDRLAAHGIDLDGMLLKPNMVVPGKASGQKASPEEVAQATLRALRQVVPPAVPGIAFLSGGQSPVEATANLNAINRLNGAPWKLSFSFGRALQDYSMAAWKGRSNNVAEAQALFSNRARCNSLACRGEYSAASEAGA
jgi:fructose-bisphosphate aldolase class I